MSRFDPAHLFEVEGPRLRRFLRRFAPGVSADDIVQDSFERLCAVDPETVASPRGLLFQTARNLAKNALIRQAKTPVSVRDPAEIEARAGDGDPEACLLRSELARGLNEVLNTLPEHKRLALYLFKVEGWSYGEIGERLGVSPRTCERYVADAIAHCYKELSGQGPQP